ncbi:hypothetical protein [Amnibacterium kyonggiense]|uniref:Uncharacterized protein n=1 Tax=Amnibacterium kyonggiense TaxID=595671 RepID=A0A4R7FT20_9MICO|nr:hypothetical protein [Amnibacterium kyonggiense]TDS81000.1 hypothetical protein CLV52_1572 [Amnibacterium kyonggiense]
MTDTVRPSFAVRRPGLVRAGRVTLVVLGWAIITWLLGLLSIFVSVFLLLMALVLVPAGFLYGVAVRAVLLRRRSAARRTAAAPLDGGDRRRLPAQRIDRWLAVLQLVVWACLGALWAATSSLELQGFIFGNTTALGNVLGSLGGTAFGMLLEVLVAIPVAAVLVTRQATDRPGIAAEAAVLAAGGADARAIRSTRTLSWIAYAVSSVVALGAIVGFVPSTLR